MSTPVSVQTPSHRVDRLRLSLSLSSEQAGAVSQRCSQLVHRELRHLIERVLTRVAPPGERVVLTTPLVLDLGTLPIANFERGFCQRLEVRLEQVLRQHLTGTGVRREGGGPAHFGRATTGSPESTVTSGRSLSLQMSPFTDEVMAVSPGNAVTPDRLPASPVPSLTDEEQTVFPSSAVTSGRSLSPQMSPFTDEVMAVSPGNRTTFGRSLTPPVASALRQLERVLVPGAGPGPVSELLDPWLLRQVERAPDIWLPALAVCLLRAGAGAVRLRGLRPTTQRRLCAMWVPEIPSPGQLTRDEVWLSALYYLLRHPDCPLPAVPDALCRGWGFSGEGETAGDHAVQLLCALFTSASGPLAPSHALALLWLRRLWQVRVVRDVVLPTLSVTQASTLRQWLEGDGREGEGDRVTPATGRQPRPVSSVPPVVRGGRPGDDTGPVAVNNAGVALLWPLFPGLFRQQGWVRETRFVDLVAQQRAACCLGTLGEGRPVREEDDMALYLLLCGLSPEIPVVCDAEDDALPVMLSAWLSQLLKAMPAPWHRISPADFREWFMQRAGWLTREQGRTVLYIEPAVYDVLLRDWPWPVEMVALPWLSGPLTLKWQHPVL